MNRRKRHVDARVGERRKSTGEINETEKQDPCLEGWKESFSCTRWVLWQGYSFCVWNNSRPCSKAVQES